MSEIDNCPAIRLKLLVVGTGEAVTNPQLKAQAAALGVTYNHKPLTGFDRSQYLKAEAAGLLTVDSPGTAAMTFRLTREGREYVRAAFPDYTIEEAGSAGKLGAAERKAICAILSESSDGAASVDDSTWASLRVNGLIRLSKKRKGVEWELTPKGFQTVETELRCAVPPSELVRVMFPLMLADLDARGRSVMAVYTDNHRGKAETGGRGRRNKQEKTVGARVIDAYHELVRGRDGWVKLVSLRDHLADIERAELDRVLSALDREGRIRLLAESNQQVLTVWDHSAAITVGGLHKHLYSVG